jgi:peroxiredoxin
MKHKSLFIAVLTMLNISAFGQSGLKAGQQAPDFSAVDYTGKKVGLKNLLKDHKAVVLFFYRGTWCPYCSKYVKNLEDSLEMLTQKGAYVVGVTPQTNENISQMADKTHASFSMVNDKGYSIMKAYDVNYKVSDEMMHTFKKYNLDLGKYNGNNDNILPVPATYIIDQSGKIVFVQFDKDFTHRASVNTILAFL